MEVITLAETDNSPAVILNSEYDVDKCLIEFSGKSYAENTFDFYEPIITWLKNYFENDRAKNTEVNLKLTYFNSATTQVLFDILDVVQVADCDGLVVNWYYDGENENGTEDFEDYSEEFPDLNIQAVKL